MANELIKAGIVLTGDARSAVDAFKQLKVAQDELREKMAASQAEVNRLARAIKEYDRLGVAPTGVRDQFEQAKAGAQSLRAQLDANTVALERGRQALRQYGISTVSLNADMKALAASQAEAARAAAALAEKNKIRNDAGFSSAGGALRASAAAVGVGVGIETVATVVRLADAYQSVDARLRLVTSSERELREIEDQLFASAQRTRTSYLAQAETFARIAGSARQAGFSLQQLAKINETINQAAQIGGGSAESINAAIVQLGQALASNRLGGDELRSILEQTPALADAIAKGLGVTTGKLRELGETGQLTTEKVLNALLKVGPEIEAKFGKIPATVGGSLEQVKNSLGKLDDTLNRSGGGTSKVAGAFSAWSRAVDSVSERIEKLRQTVDDAGIESKIEGLGKAAEALRNLGLNAEADAALAERAKLQARYAEILSKTAVTAQDAAQNQRELNRQYDGAAPPVEGSKAFLDLQAKLTGASNDYQVGLTTLFEAYTKGVIPLERYRELVGKLITTETEAGKNAKRVADERIADSKRMAEQTVRDQQAVIDAVRKSFQENLADAKKFSEQAAQIRTAGAKDSASVRQQAEDRRNADKPDDEKDAAQARRARELVEQASTQQARSVLARGQGKIEDAKKAITESRELLNQAQQAAASIKSNDKAARLLDEVADAKDKVTEAEAKLAEKQGSDASTTAERQRTLLAELEQRAAVLQAAFEKIKVSLDTEDAVAALEAFRAEAGKGATVPLRVTSNGTQTTPADGQLPGLAQLAQGFAGGGAIEGPGPRGVDSLLAMLAPGEHVLTAREVAAAGGHGAIYALRAAMLAQRVPRFAEGGAVGRMGAAPRTEAAGMVPARFVFPGVGEVSALVERRDADGLGKQLRRVATARGARR